MKLLQEAGYSKENPVRFTVLYNTLDGHTKIAVAAASIWKQNLAGMVEVKLQNQEWKTFLESHRLGKYQVARSSWCADYNEPSSFLNTLLSNSSNNHTLYRNPELDQLMHQALLTADETHRAALYAQVESIIDRDTVLLPMYYYTATRLVKPYVGGFVGNSMSSIYSKDLYIIKH